ncbi:MAG: HAMP domain-containing protein [Gammaproteobacteria bacterium]|nr:HAMP domain-containing protein [Gammaproteobacteria bacterium]
MEVAVIRRLGTGIVPAIVLCGLLLVSLYLMSAATQNSEQFSRLYFTLLLINVLGLITLVILIGFNIVRLLRQYRHRAVGSRLTLRLVILFSLLALLPVSILYYFSLQFIQRGIDSWLDVRVEQALDGALEVSRASLDNRRQELLAHTDQMALELRAVPPLQLPAQLQSLRSKHQAQELGLLSRSGRLVAFAPTPENPAIPSVPVELLVQEFAKGAGYLSIEDAGNGTFRIRVLADAGISSDGGEPLLLYAVFPATDRATILAGNMQSAYAEYKKVILLRDPLKFSFTLTLSLILLLTLLAAVWAAFFAARRLVAPIRVLAIGTRAVAFGDYNKRLPQHGHDELGFLVESFNEMTRRIAEASDETERSRQQVERERAYLRAVLGRLSSGVLTLDLHGAVRTANSAAGQILAVESRELIGLSLQQFSAVRNWLGMFAGQIQSHVAGDEAEWREEIRISTDNGQKVLICAGTRLSSLTGRHAGQVIVFEDVTALVQAQRDAAWGEVARRLAHEIKNPLTPIQLSAERLRHKYLAKLAPADAEGFDRLTYTIVQQVEAMKEMVNAFSDYARAPQLQLKKLQLNTLVEEILVLYREGGCHARLVAAYGEGLPEVAVDAGRIRQLLHNLIKNALEAFGAVGVDQGEISVTTRRISEAGRERIELAVTDNGPGIPAEILEHLFEPYVTVKARGSGLGMAVVKKIVEEHAGTVWARNNEGGGATVIVQLPVEALSRTQDAEHRAAAQSRVAGGNR